MAKIKEYINRPLYIRQLIDRRENGDIKIITGPRRCGKSWLLKHLYADYLIADGVPQENIIAISLDQNDDQEYNDLTDVNQIKRYIHQRIQDDATYYLFLDEVQEIDGFEKLVNGLNARDNIDVYITGSNSKFLSSDIRTIFRGRGDEIRVWPLSFKEFLDGRDESISELWKEFYTYGGMPALRNRKKPDQKVKYLKQLWDKTYIDDVVERNNIRNRQAMESLVDALCSAIGSLTIPSRVAAMLWDRQKLKIDSETVKRYIDALENAFLFEGAQRFNIKGNEYYNSIQKYYAGDIGLRNARLKFRQQEISHIMENIIYTELRIRGYMVDVGVVEVREQKDGKLLAVKYEVDFIATNGISKYYIQSAYRIDDADKLRQETNSFNRISDSFTKVLIVGDDIATFTDDCGYVHLGLFQFLRNNDILE